MLAGVSIWPLTGEAKELPAYTVLNTQRVCATRGTLVCVATHTCCTGSLYRKHPVCMEAESQKDRSSSPPPPDLEVSHATAVV